MINDDTHILLAPYNAVCIDIAKVASSSLKIVFADLLGLDLEAAHGNPHQVDFPHPDGLDVAGERFYSKYTSFAFVRNPFDRLVSCYRDKFLGEAREFTELSESGIAHCLSGYDAFWTGMSFDDFVQAVASIPDDQADEHFRSQHAFVANTEGAIAVDFICKFETIKHDFPLLAEKIGLPSRLQLPKRQAASTQVDYRGFYSPEAYALVYERYEEDFKCFSYSGD